MKKGAVSYLFDNLHMKLHEGLVYDSIQFLLGKTIFRFDGYFDYFYLVSRNSPLRSPRKFSPEKFPPGKFHPQENSSPREIPTRKFLLLGKLPPRKFPAGIPYQRKIPLRNTLPYATYDDSLCFLTSFTLHEPYDIFIYLHIYAEL